MRSRQAVLAGVLLLFAWSCSAESHVESPAEGLHPLRIATFNVHYISPRQERMRWEDRRAAVLAAVEDLDADIIGFQEMETFVGGSYNRENRQLYYLLSRLPQDAAVAVGPPAEYPSTQPIFVRADRYHLEEQGFFFFSDTPDEIYSRSWDGRFPAFCSWARLSDRDADGSLLVFNVHFDAGSGGNRRRAAELVASRLETIARSGEARVVVGDFNAAWFFPAVRRVSHAGLNVADTRGSTYHFYRGIRFMPAIDHVLYSDELTHRRTDVIRSRYDGVWPSDHYPVAVDFSYTPATANR